MTCSTVLLARYTIYGRLASTSVGLPVLETSYAQSQRPEVVGVDECTTCASAPGLCTLHGGLERVPEEDGNAADPVVGGTKEGSLITSSRAVQKNLFLLNAATERHGTCSRSLIVARTSFRPLQSQHLRRPLRCCSSMLKLDNGSTLRTLHQSGGTGCTARTVGALESNHRDVGLLLSSRVRRSTKKGRRGVALGRCPCGAV